MRKPRPSLLTALVILTPAALTHAQEAPEDEDDAGASAGYSTTVTTARKEEETFRSPRLVTVVGRAELDERLSRTTPEALFEESGVFVQRTNYGGGTPIIRGQYGNRILVLVDGIRLNNSSFRTGPNQYVNTIDPLIVDRLEVVRGPGAALFGSDAIGGTINVRTLQPRTSEAGGQDWYGSARLAAGSVDESGQLGLRLGWAGPSAGVQVVGGVRHFGDVRAADGYRQPFTGYDEWSAAAAALWTPAADHRVTVNLQTTRQLDVPRSDRSTPLDFRQFSVQSRVLGYARWTGARLGPFAATRATVSVGVQGEVQDRFRVARDAREQDEVTVSTLGLQLEGESELGAAGSLVLGADGYVDLYDAMLRRGSLAGELADVPEARRYPDGVGYGSFAFFGHHDLPLGARWSLVGDLRLGLTRIHVPDDDRLRRLFPDENIPVLEARTEALFTYAGGLHLRAELLPWLAASAGVMLGFRAPNMDDSARLGVEGPAFVVPSAGISTERAYSGELGLKALAEHVEGSAFYSYSYIDDAIGRQLSSIGSLTTIDGLPVMRLTNNESARYHAIELAGRARPWRDLAVFGTFSWVKGEQTVAVPPAAEGGAPTTMDEPATRTPPPSGTVGAGWRAPRKWFAEAVLRFALDQERLSEADRADTRICPDLPGPCAGTPGWTVLALRGGVSLADHLRVTLVLDNLTDASYRMHASGVQGSGLGVAAMLEGSL